MKKYSPPPLATAVIVATLLLAIYGVKAWYFPTGHSRWLLVAPGVLGIPLAIWMYKHIRHLYSSQGLKLLAFGCMVLLVPMTMCFALGIGVPALTLRLMGPDTALPATVLRKERGSRRCRRQIFLAEYRSAFDRLCVSPEVFEKLEEGQRVLLQARKSPLGVFVFSIEPS